MALMGWATHMIQWWLQREAKEQSGANPKKPSQFRLRAATRPHEDGIASNRRSACYGEYVTKSCTHRPSHHGRRFELKCSEYLMYFQNICIFRYIFI